jgi:hypothetical protein
MSEPQSAFLKLRIDRAKLVRWLNAPVARASRWSDWREMGGKYYNHGVQELRDYSDIDMAEAIAKADGFLRRFQDNRAALQDIMSTAETPQFKRASYQTETRDFVAGSLTYAENLINYIMFYAIVRGAEALLGADDYGIAAIHNFIWGDERARVTHSAMRLGPGVRSEFMSGTDMNSAGGAFQEIATEMMPLDATAPPVLIDELDGLR